MIHGCRGFLQNYSDGVARLTLPSNQRCGPVHFVADVAVVRGYVVILGLDLLVKAVTGQDLINFF